MSVNPRFSVPTSSTLTRDPQNAYTTQLTDGTLTQTRTYNNFGEVTQVSDNTFTYTLTQRDNAGAIVQKQESINGITETYDYTYDNMGRVTQVQKNNTVTETYTYDNNGNRASATLNGTTLTANYTLDDNLVVYGQNTYSYDNDGYLQTKTTPNGTTTYGYGTLGELLSVTTPTKTITYTHNANNQRVAKLVNGAVVEKYLWANLTTLLATYDANDNLVQRFEYADQRMPVAMTQGSMKYYLHYDQVGSLRAVTDDSHNIVKEIVYDTYGNILNDTNPTFKVPFGFAGGLYDSDTKLTRFGYRDYDAYVGKWTAKDPIGFDGGDSNLYGYVLGDPVDFVDPTGLWKINFNYFNFFGVGISFGVNPDGRSFFDLKVGIGFGYGFSYTPDGKSPNYRDDGCYGSGGGGYAKAGANAGPLSLDYGGSAGASSGAKSIGNSIYGSQQSGFNIGKSLGLGASLSAGGEGIITW